MPQARELEALRETQSLKSWHKFQETVGFPCLLLLGASEKIQGWSPSSWSTGTKAPFAVPPLHPSGFENVNHKPKPSFPRPKLPQCLYATHECDAFQRKYRNCFLGNHVKSRNKKFLIRRQDPAG